MVTGATGGIGKALVGRLIADGNNVIAAARDPARLSRGTGPGRLMCLRLDMERADTIAAAAAEAAKIAGDDGVFGLVNMAGIIVEGPVEAIPPAELRRQLDINVVGPTALTQALLPLLKRARGRVINIGAISAHITVPFYGPIRRQRHDRHFCDVARPARRHLGGPAGARTPLSGRSCRHGSRL